MSDKTPPILSEKTPLILSLSKDSPKDGLATRRCEPNYLSKAAPRPLILSLYAHPEPVEGPPAGNTINSTVIPASLFVIPAKAGIHSGGQAPDTTGRGRNQPLNYPEDNLEREILSNE